MQELNYKAIPESNTEDYTSKKDILDLAKAAIENKFIGDDEKHLESFHKFLTWIKSDSPYANAFWHWVHTNKTDFKKRDDYILELWETINDPENSNNKAKASVENQLTDWSYYQNHFFHWFLSRYHVPYSRAIFSNCWFIKWIHHFVFAIYLVLFFAYYFLDISVPYWAFVSVGVLLIPSIALIVCCSTDLKFPYFIHSMVPRLGATIAIGYLFLLSVPDFVAKIYDNSEMFNEPFQYSASGVLLLFVLFFISLNIHKRVKPPLNVTEILCRTVDLLVIGVTYAIMGLLVFERILYYSAIDKIQNTANAPCISQLLFFTTFSLAIGVIFQLMWEEKPVTEPL